MNIPGELIALGFVLIGLVILVLIALVLGFLWKRIGTTVKTIIKVVIVLAIVAGIFVGASWLVDPFNQARLENASSSTVAFAKAWWVMNIGDLPNIAGLIPGTNGGQPKPAAPQTTIDLSGLAEPLPKVPVQVNFYKIKDLPKFRGSKQVLVEQADVLVAVNGVISPTLSSIRATTTTISKDNIINDNLPARVPMTATLQVQIFRDGTVVVSNRPFSETVQLWLQGIQTIANPIVELDEQPEVTRRVPKNDPRRQQLRDAMTSIETLLDFQPELVTGMGVASMDKISNFVKTQNLTTRIRLAVFQAQFCGVGQAPRDRNEGGTPALRGLVDCVRTKYHQLDARTAELIWSRDPAKAKQDTSGWKEAQKEVLKALSELNDMIDKLDTEVEAQGLDSGNRVDYEQVYDMKLVDLLLDAEMRLMALKATLEAP
ncbi:MAG: hypothetical protein UV05_C0011G0029 [candidate division CPR1 bacterium GW2011_GWA2_42_17]|uniref:Uncharacterized protein n=1 Tax=candidate division CPR1 bacterium GW2011_GWA2_42_17 TaxID=1618341 RepID=A0A0G1C3C1_9BACT|nr:MAG: hypothetical protein UV05_C0011G0029 [candidate division CPR1 bacterium GW2011_GWA2_42_17]